MVQFSKIVNKYSNGEITIVWEPGKCIHAGNCVRGLPEVFNARIKPWINAEGADTKSIIDQVKNCPSISWRLINLANFPNCPR